MKINLAIIGAGRIGHVHAEAINKNINANLIYVYDTNNSVANKFASKFNFLFILMFWLMGPTILRRLPSITDKLMLVKNILVVTFR